MTKFYDRINNVHKRPLHKAQIAIAKDYFVRGKRLCMSQWARDLGKTEAILYIASVACALNDNFWVMIVCPEAKQGRKIYASKDRLKNYPPPEYIVDYNITDQKLTFANGSIITVEGCENYEALRGSKPDLVIYDEFQHHSKEFHVEVMSPNTTRDFISLLVFGTPPKQRSAYYNQFKEELLERIKEGSSDESYSEYDIYNSTIHNKARLDQRRIELFKAGDEAVWYREYMGKSVFGGEGVVFPKWNPKIHVKPHEVVMSYLEKDRKKLKWFTICDPGSSSCFAVLFVCYNPFTQQLFLLDEIYEKDRNRTDSRQIWNRIRAKEKELHPTSELNDWKRYYDEAAAWFRNEIGAMHRGVRLSLSPTNKQSSNADTDISRIKMAMAQEGALTVSDRCKMFQWEVESYVTKENSVGDIVYMDINDHLIDCTKYLMQVCGWTLMERAEDILLNAELISKGAIAQSVDNWADSALEGSLNPGMYDRNFDDFFH